MENVAGYLISGISEIIIFSVLPLCWWFFTSRGKESFFRWIGLKGIKENHKKVLLISLITEAAFAGLGIAIMYLFRNVQSASSAFLGMGIGALPAALVYAFINTALPEEILFRGFILKRFSSKFGFYIGNSVQAFLFGIMHGVLFWGVAGAFKALALTAATGAIAWAMGYVNEREAGGSIIPSWLIHGLSNTISAIIAMFSVF